MIARGARAARAACTRGAREQAGGVRLLHSSIGLACAQAVAIRGSAPYAARRHAAMHRALQLRVALDDWERNDFHERVRA